MHRFVTEYLKKPVAVNDLGRVAFDNEKYVLDLWGLGSEEARRKRRTDTMKGDNWMEKMAAEKGIHVVMIYANWFKERLPSSWELLGKLKMNIPYKTAGGATVDFYATPLANKFAVQEALIERGVSRGAVRYEGFGSTQPVLVDGVEDKVASRRVEFAVDARAAGSTDPVTPGVTSTRCKSSTGTP